MRYNDSHIYYDSYSYERNGNLRDFAKNTFITSLIESIGRKCIVVLGGDGTMLRAIREHASEDIPFLGVNFWHKGFLLNHPSWIYPGIPEFSTRKYPLLDITSQGETLWKAFNDINIYSPEWKAISLHVDIWSGQTELWGDGLILTTPAGSTGHSQSYGWPILPHSNKSLVLTPKGNISPQKPKSLDDTHKIVIRNTWRKYPLWVNLDGEQILITELNESLELEIKKSQQEVELLIATPHLRDWDNKVLWEQGFSV